MAKQRLFPKAPANTKRTPHDKFAALASKVVTVPKAEIDSRETQWRKRKSSHTS
jgi:hypothetical protein